MNLDYLTLNKELEKMKEVFYLDVTCKSCQWIINKELELSTLFQKGPVNIL